MASSWVTEVMGSDAKIWSPSRGDYSSQVSITAPDGTKIFTASQRDCYSKYRWPAKAGAIDALKAYAAKQ